MYVYMYVCMYACMYVRMYICKYVYMYICMYVRTYVYIYVYVCILYVRPTDRMPFRPRGSKFILATTLPSTWKFHKTKRTLQSYVHWPIAVHSPSLPSVPNFSAHPIAIATPSVLVTHCTLPEDFGLLASIQPSCNQVDISPSQHLQYMSPHTHTSNCT